MKETVQLFLHELGRGLPKRSADSSLLRVCELQKKRLDAEGILMRVKAEPYGHFPDGMHVVSWRDRHYRTDVIATTSMYHRTFYKKGQTKPLLDDTDNYLIYTDVTECLDYSVAGGEPYVCPSCGKVSTLQALSTEGCTYCGTRFSMAELYPRVTGYYAIKNMGGTSQEINKDIFKFTRPTCIIFAVLALLGTLTQIDMDFPLLSVLTAVFYLAVGLGMGFVFGYLLWVGKTLGRLFLEAGRSIPKLSALGSSKAFTRCMKQYSEEFSYEFFTDKVISLLKAVIYSSSDSELPFYQGRETVQFDHVVEASFGGALDLKHFEVKDNIVTVDVVAFMENFYAVDGKVRKKTEKIPMTLQKDLSGEMNYHFNIRAVKCPSCGASFDATSSRCCPYCNQPLDLRRSDWVIVRM